MFTQEDIEEALTELFLTCCLPPLIFVFLWAFFHRYLNLHRRLGWKKKERSITNGESAEHEPNSDLFPKNKFVPYQGIDQLPRNLRLRNNLPVAMTWFRYTSVGLFILLPIVAALALPAPSDICDRGYEGYFYSDGPAWAADCEEHARYHYEFVGDFEGRFEPHGPYFETRAMLWHFVLVCPLVLYYMVLARFDEKRRVDDRAVSFVHWAVALNVALMVVYSLALIHNMATLPDASLLTQPPDYVEFEWISPLHGPSGPSAYDLISTWQQAHTFHALFPIVSWCLIGIPVAMLLGWLDDPPGPDNSRSD